MDPLELSAVAVVAIFEKEPKAGCSHDDMKLFNLRKSLDLRYAIADLGTVLRAQLARRLLNNQADKNGSAVPVVISSPAATRQQMEKLAATATLAFKMPL